jgi:hypothetical protein
MSKNDNKINHSNTGAMEYALQAASGTFIGEDGLMVNVWKE